MNSIARTRLPRRDFLQLGMATAAAGAAGFFVEDAVAQRRDGLYADINRPFDRFVADYMRAMHAPAMTLVLADREGVRRVASYGFGDIERQRAPRADELFQIGSISKSFVALCLMQLHDEGKLDLHRPIVEYLPWLRIESSFAPITTHHLLTHTSGLPGAAAVFLSDPSQRHRAAYEPGRHYYYNNMAYTVLGYLAWTLDGRELPELLRARVLRPLGMNQSEPSIDLGMRHRQVKNYSSLRGDALLPIDGPLCEAPAVIETSGAGCVAATAHDMGLYVQMLANRGAIGERRLVSEASFDLFARHHIDSGGSGGPGYGYGIALDKLDGAPVLRHTGGMVSFSSAVMVDVEAGVGAFASVNVQKDYRPMPVVELAVRMMRARRSRTSLPAPPKPNGPAHIDNASDYARVYRNSAGESLELVAEGSRLTLLHQGARVGLERGPAPDTFIVRHEDFSRFPLVCSRKQAPDAKGPVVEAAWGPKWYVAPEYDGPTKFDTPGHWTSYVGHYRNESPWLGSLRIVLRAGRLFINGITRVEADGPVFRLRDDPHSTEWLQFGQSVNGVCMHLKLSGADFWRVEAE